MTPRLGSVLALLVSLSALGGCGGSPESSPPPERPVEEAPPAIDPATIFTGEPVVSRLLVLALDGATWDLIDPLLAQGRLPHLARLTENGVRASLQTLEPTVSPAIWTTIATGFLPRRHGILGFEGVPGRTMTTLPNAGMRQVKTYWEILSGFGVTTGTIGWWATWPASPLGEGSWLVSDRVPYTRMEAAIERAQLASGDTYPDSLLDVVAPLVERPNEIDPAVLERFLKIGPEERDAFLGLEYRMGSYLPEFKFVHQSDRSTLLLAMRLLRDRPVDVASIYFTGIDTVSHLYWHFAFPEGFSGRVTPADVTRFGPVIGLYYELIDGYLGELLAACGEGTTVLVVSDHGFGGTGNLPWSGGHGALTPGAPIAPDGVLVLSGPGIRADGHRLAKAHVLDVAPTILRLLGIPPSEEMLGRVLEEAFAPSPGELARIESHEDVGTRRAPGAIPVDPAGDAERLERLRALGYIQ